MGKMSKLMRELPKYQELAEAHDRKADSILENAKQINVLVKEIYRIILLIQKQYPEKEEK